MAGSHCSTQASQELFNGYETLPGPKAYLAGTFTTLANWMESSAFTGWMVNLESWFVGNRTRRMASCRGAARRRMTFGRAQFLAGNQRRLHGVHCGAGGDPANGPSDGVGPGAEEPRREQSAHLPVRLRGARWAICA